MKRLFLAILILILAIPFPVLAETGERGVTGGITEGIGLPKTTEQILAQTATTGRRQAQTLEYTEMVFLSGQAQRFDGVLTITQNGQISDTAEAGTYTVTYNVAPAEGTEVQDPLIDRTITLRVNWRRVTSSGQQQLILDYSSTSWAETIIAGGTTYTLVPGRSYFGRSIIKDITPGVTYYKGETSRTAYYTGATAPTTVETYGSIYGYDCAWSKTETERLNVTVNSGNGWQLEAQVRPSVSVNKVLQYSPNEPTAISFDGNYYEVLRNSSNLSWNIYTIPRQFERRAVLSGAANIPNTNKFEMLPAPDLSFLKGHFAESDIKKLFAMQILEGIPNQFQPAQAMTRGQFVTALVKAFKIPIEEPQTSGRRNTRATQTPAVTVLFPDVTSNRGDFQYLMAAYKSGVVLGRYQPNSDNRFRPDDAITMEEAIVLLVRALGLENLGLTPTTVTVFSDDPKISSWAKKEMSAAFRIGIIDMDAYGNINPQKKLTKAEGAALINRVVDYMRIDLPVDYVENILNFAD